jgi:hypothetical protein
MKVGPKLGTAELTRFIEIISATLQTFETRNSTVDFSKLFRKLELPELTNFSFTETKKVIQDVDIRCLVTSCPNITYLNLSSVPSIDNNLLLMALKELP